MDVNVILLCAGAFVLAFLLGSIPWGVIVSNGVFHKDIRSVGSGNIGTTNAFRAMGKVGGCLVFLLDFGKGLLSGFLAGQLAGLVGADDLVRQAFLCTAMAGCVWGHVFSPWLKFKGGKGIAVAIGCLFVTFGVGPSILELALFAAIVLITRYVSLGSIMAALLCPFLAFYLFWGEWYSIAITTAAALTIVWAHRGNINRLVAGTENRVGAKKKE
ncbi:MAG: glycerol-3-phosphate 1-O-acyltransferase PlsY [Coriobacteriia bacterium]|nr:glycerol-3-phosphate 1-O-acyltransferase PlsY [Coriobacteriia bacterium]